jgi:hypothetical protein
MRFLIALALFTAACKKEDKADPGGAVAIGSGPCEAAVARGVDQTISKRRGSDAPAMTPEEAEVPKRLKVALGKSCVDDKWSPEIIECFKTADDIATCKEKLTPEQRAAYSRAAMGVMQGARGSGGMPSSHGMPGGAPPAGSSAPAGSGSN